MIIQRQTFLDPFLLKVVFPYLRTTNRKALRRLTGFWNDEVPAEQVLQASQGSDWLQTMGRYAVLWQTLLGTLARALQPQVLAPISNVTNRGGRGARPTRGEG